MGLHEIQSGIKKYSPLVVDRSHPDRQVRSFISRAKPVSGGLLWTSVPNKEADVVPLEDADLFVLIGLAGL